MYKFINFGEQMEQTEALICKCECVITGYLAKFNKITHCMLLYSLPQTPHV